MKRIAVLGSNSFAGAQLVNEALSRKYEVTGFNRSGEQSDIFLPYKAHPSVGNYTFIQMDINQNMGELIAALAALKPEIIVDFAGQGMVAESWQHPEQWYQTNVVAKVKLHNFLKDQPWLTRYIRISTPEVYGSNDNLIDESAVFNPSTPYAVSHAAIDMSLKAFHKQYNFPVIFTRFSNFYGPGQQLYRIIPRTIIYARLNKVLSLHGGGTSVRAFIHGKDVANAIFASIEHGKAGETYHFSTDRFVTIRELVELIHSKMKVNTENLTSIGAERPGKDHQYLMDDHRAQNELGWLPEVSLETGIQQCIAWVDEHMEEIQQLPLNYEHKI